MSAIQYLYSKEIVQFLKDNNIDEGCIAQIKNKYKEKTNFLLNETMGIFNKDDNILYLVPISTNNAILSPKKIK